MASVAVDVGAGVCQGVSVGVGGGIVVGANVGVSELSGVGIGGHMCCGAADVDVWGVFCSVGVAIGVEGGLWDDPLKRRV